MSQGHGTTPLLGYPPEGIPPQCDVCRSFAGSRRCANCKLANFCDASCLKHAWKLKVAEGTSIDGIFVLPFGLTMHNKKMCEVLQKAGGPTPITIIRCHDLGEPSGEARRACKFVYECLFDEERKTSELLETKNLRKSALAFFAMGFAYQDSQGKPFAMKDFDKMKSVEERRSFVTCHLIQQYRGAERDRKIFLATNPKKLSPKCHKCGGSHPIPRFLDPFSGCTGLVCEKCFKEEMGW
mmetsp:Transcript_14335/g.34316  ORF Transcript_14335/g.34316 Transcript_14335/m.34316 type:complete len:239 (+) Transcript_14335:25-741(+)